LDPQPQASQPADQEDVAASPESSPPQETESGWFRRTLDRLTGRSAPEPDEEAPAAEETPREEQAPPDRVTLTKDELARLIQAETDRREARRNQPTRAQLRNQEKQLLDDNPWEAAERRKAQLAEEEAQEARQQALAGVVQVADQAMLDPVLTRLPEREWRQLIAEHGDALTSFQGRQALVTAAVERIETMAVEKAKQTLRSTKTAEGRAFRKELLSELRGGLPEPELVQPGARSAGANGHQSENGFMNSALRRAARSALAARERDDDADLDDDT
jgi:hypothetical protein